MHSRYTRPVEHARTAPRRTINVTQQHAVNPVIEVVTGPPVPQNQVLTGYIYQHNSAAASTEHVLAGIDPARRSGTPATFPVLATPFIAAYGFNLSGQAWPAQDKNLQSTLYWQSSPLGNPAGFVEHAWSDLAFAGSCSTVSLRNALPGDVPPVAPTRPYVPPPPPGHGGGIILHPPGGPPPRAPGAGVRLGSAPVPYNPSRYPIGFAASSSSGAGLGLGSGFGPTALPRAVAA